MRYDRLARFLLVVFLLGGALGLISGLVFGKRTEAAAAREATAKTQQTTSTTQQAAAGGPMTPEKARTIGANEMGLIPVLEYHRITTPEDQAAPEPEYSRSALHFKQDVELLRAEGYYPITIKELVAGNIDIPAGKSPVVFTFDDSSIGQYRILDDGTIDPQCAVGILKAASQDGSWPLKASFYVLLDVDLDEHILFGQPEFAQAKLKNLVSWGCEVGSHTYTHLDLKKSTEDVIRKELALSKKKIESLIGGDYQVDTLSVPFGNYPKDISIIKSGEYNGVRYAYKAALEVTGGPSCSPFSKSFDPWHIPRVVVQHDSLKNTIDYLKKNPQLRYVSDGDPNTISFPASLSEKLGLPRDNLPGTVVTY